MKQLRMHDITFELMDKRQSDYFRASYLMPSNGSIPGIPMYHRALYEAERKGEFLCESLVLTFENPEGRFSNLISRLHPALF